MANLKILFFLSADSICIRGPSSRVESRGKVLVFETWSPLKACLVAYPEGMGELGYDEVSNPAVPAWRLKAEANKTSLIYYPWSWTKAGL